MASFLNESFVSKTLDIIRVLLLLNTQILVGQVVNGGEKPVNVFRMYDVTSVVYSQPGDINIGDITQVYHTINFYKCRDKIEPYALTDHTEAIKFAVDWVNKQPGLLPNVTLGFILRGTCLNSFPLTLANALLFLPRNKPICNDSTCTTQSMMSSLDSQNIENEVIGVLSPTESDLAVILSYFFSMSRIPMVGYNVGGEELSNMRYHRHFFAINTRDYYQVKGMLKFISDNGWSYIQFIYRDTYYGRDARKYLYKMAGEYGICIAASHLFTTYKANAKALMGNPLARVVIIFLANWRFYNLLKEIIPLNGSGHFIWIGSDYMENYYYKFPQEPIDPGVGAFIFFPYTRVVNEYYDYVKSIDVYKTKNPWLKEAWERLRGCSYEECPRNESEALNFNPRKTASLRMDAVLTFAYAAHNLIQDHCPGVTGMAARACITGDLLTEYLRKVKFDGFSGSVEFTTEQQVMGKFIIFQANYDINENRFYRTGRKRVNHIPVAVYDSMSANIIYMDNQISWSNVNRVERLVPVSNDSLAKDIPESVCSRPCVVGEYKIEKDLPCCWDCLRCRDNERLINENTGCEGCPLFQWPDPFSDFTTCVDIPLTYQTLKDPIPIALVSITGFVLTLTIFVYSAYVKYRNERVIKASSKELSFIQLVGISGGYVTVILFQTTPTDIMCRFIFFLFCMSFAMLYSPLLVKTVRIFRIFRSASENKKPGFVSPQSQLIISILLITIQLLVCGAVYFLYVPGARRTQPVWSEKMVELSCDFTIPGLASFLGYNILLVALCSVFAFMVRKLPDNYNESRFISMCVSTTLLIWMAFIPTYFTADREYMRMFLLCMALLLNHSVALVLLFFPRIHAATFMKDESLNFAMKK